MKLIESPFAKDIITVHQFDFGNLYILEDSFVSEINEGVNMDYDNLLELLNALLIFSENKEEINYVSNRINCYSLDLPAFQKASKHFTLKANVGCITYTNASESLTRFQISFLKCLNTTVFNSLEQAAQWFSKPAQLI